MSSFPTPPDPAATAEETVRAFCAAFGRASFSPDDIAALLDWFSADATYHNMPTDPAVGHEAIRGVLDMFLPAATDVEFEVLSLVAAGDLVLTERIDRMTLGDRRVELPVAGAFEVVDGRIMAWRDYFDMASFFGA